MLNQISFKMLNADTLKLFNRKIAGIKNVSKLKKKELLDSYNTFLACKIIQRCFRNHFYKNAECSISLEPVRYPCFIYRTKSSSHCFFYNYDSIIKYIMKTGDTRDPMTRNAYSDNDLNRLDTEAKIHYPEIRYSSTLKIKKNINYAKRIRNRENEILSYQTYIEELKNKILVIVESDSLSWEPFGAITIDSVEFHSIKDYVLTLLQKIKTVYVSLNNYDHFSASCFKESMILSMELYSEVQNVQFIATFFQTL